MKENEGFPELLRNRKFTCLWTNQILFQLAYNMVNFSLIIWVFKLTGSNTAVSLFVLTVIVPAVIFGAFAGVFADRLDKRKIIMITDLLLVILMLGMVFIKASIWWILPMSFLINSVTNFFMPSEASAIPMLVQKRLLLTANSLFTFTMYASMVFGFSLAGPIIELFGPDAPFIIAALFILTGFFTVRNLPSLQAPGAKTFKFLISQALDSTFNEVRIGLDFVLKTKIVIIPVLLLTLTQAVISLLSVLLPAFFERVLQVSSTAASYVVIVPLGAGLVAGALFVGKFGKRFRKRYLITRAVLFLGMAFIMVAWAPLLSTFLTHNVVSLERLSRPIEHIFSLSIFISLMSFIIGAGNVFVVIPAQTTLQEQTPAQIRGRVFAVLGIMIAAASSLPILLVGRLADLFGTLPIFGGLGIILLIMGVLAIHPKILSFLVDLKLLPEKLEDFVGGKFTT